MRPLCLPSPFFRPVCGHSEAGWVTVKHDDDLDEPAAKRSKKNPAEEDPEAAAEVQNGTIRDTLSKEERLKRAQALTATRVRVARCCCGSRRN